MAHELYRSAMPVSGDELYAWHARPGAFGRLTPPWEDAELTHATGLWGEGIRWTIRTRLLGPVKTNWVAEHFDVVPGRQFCDRQLKGPFARWEHTHRFIPEGETSILEDAIDYTPPLHLPVSFIIRDRLKAMFDYRHAITREDLRRHAHFQSRPRLSVAVTGSSGLIGSEVVNFLTSGGHRVKRLVRGEAKPKFDDGTLWQSWTPKEPLPAGALSGVDALIHLAGDNIASGRWTDAKKAKIRDSRIIPTRHLAAAVERDGVKVFLSGSAVGGYGDRGDELLTEDSALGSGFLAEVCREWEEASQCRARVVNLRTGIVLSPKAGALAKQLPAFRLGQGAVLGSGTQYTPWIDINDMVYAIHHLLMSDVRGPVNLCSPSPVTNRVFGRVLARVLRRPYLLTVPPFALRLLFGELADAALLASTQAVPAKLQADGFEFMNAELEPSLRMLLGRSC